MKKTILTSVSILALLALASCSTDNMPTEATGNKQENMKFNAVHNNGVNEIITPTDSIPSPSENASRSDNGDIIILKDKKKINSSSSVQENGDIIILKDKKK